MGAVEAVAEPDRVARPAPGVRRPVPCNFC